jgi:hypothetical protein
VDVLSNNPQKILFALVGLGRAQEDDSKSIHAWIDAGLKFLNRKYQTEPMPYEVWKSFFHAYLHLSTDQSNPSSAGDFRKDLENLVMIHIPMAEIAKSTVTAKETRGALVARNSRLEPQNMHTISLDLTAVDPAAEPIQFRLKTTRGGYAEVELTWEGRSLGLGRFPVSSYGEKNSGPLRLFYAIDAAVQHKLSGLAGLGPTLDPCVRTFREFVLKKLTENGK